MEEWHQKLHNNTSPDDVVICEALLAYIDSGLDLSAYWSHLQVLDFRSIPRAFSVCVFFPSGFLVWK